MTRARIPLGAGLVLLALSGCSDLTGPRLLTTFEWGEVEEPDTIVEGISTTVALGDLFLVGQFRTPSHCYELDSDFQRDGTRLTVRVEARPTGSPNCDQSPGGFRYTASVTNLKFDTYELRVIHDVTGGSGGEYTKTVTIR